jgi:hypothetical protein
MKFIFGFIGSRYGKFATQIDDKHNGIYCLESNSCNFGALQSFEVMSDTLMIDRNGT